MVKITCFVCSGSGYIRNSCHLCGGTGRRHNFWDKFLYTCQTYQKCGHCDGKGSYETAYKTNADPEAENYIEIPNIVRKHKYCTYLLFCVAIILPIAIIGFCLWLAFNISNKHNDDIFSPLLPN